MYDGRQVLVDSDRVLFYNFQLLGQLGLDQGHVPQFVIWVTRYSGFLRHALHLLAPVQGLGLVPVPIFVFDIWDLWLHTFLGLLALTHSVGAP